ncbi:deSI-like protein At4g17486 isoform X1 [Andrographis paniculata]|uniref:deSI-like protein At4g17486 isoform X1 n=1 Tax=Andrographis paniculata TaxID=175694 RepID=UPI0021E78066|nr:deSI-like protein At4g17486 isoform X1 [Andrographis paniculata]
MVVCWKSSIKPRPGSVAVHLNVYDLSSVNGYAYWLGLGVFHSGVRVHGVEYAYGAHEFPSTGIFEAAEAKQCEGITLRKSILVGWTSMSRGEVKELMEELADKYRGDAYNLIANNCNHFCNDACVRLTGNAIPRWVNRLARIGLLCKCVVPLNSTKVGSSSRIGEKDCQVEKKKLTTAKHSSRFFNSTSCSSSSSLSLSPPLVVAAKV